MILAHRFPPPEYCFPCIISWEIKKNVEHVIRCHVEENEKKTLKVNEVIFTSFVEILSTLCDSADRSFWS